jgi:hypothetical protein
MTKLFVTSLKKRKFFESQSVPFKVSFRHGDDDYEGEYAAIFSIFGSENITFSTDSKEDLQSLLFSVAFFIGSSAENLKSIPLGNSFRS